LIQAPLFIDSPEFFGKLYWRVRFLLWLGYERDYLKDIWYHPTLIFRSITMFELMVSKWWYFIYLVFGHRESYTVLTKKTVRMI